METSRATRSREANGSQNKLVKHAEWMSGGSRSFVQGTGDFNGDGKSDILWQGDDGTPAIWFMDGMNFLSGGAAGSFNPGHDWHVIA